VKFFRPSVPAALHPPRNHFAFPFSLFPFPFTSALLRRFPGLGDPPLLWLLSALSLAAAPHIVRLPVWVPVVFLWLALLRLSVPLSTGRHGGPDRLKAASASLKLLIGAGIVAGVYASYGTLIGRDAGVALLILLAGMKLVEIRHGRDYYVATFIGLFLLLTNFFYVQSIPIAVHTLLCVTAFLAALIGFNDDGRILRTGAGIRLAATILLQALPLMLILFLLFPRVPGPLWGLPKDVRAARSGLDDQMTPGAISQLALSDAVAFRVEFDGALPARADRYWRGPVLWFTDGFKWLPDRQPPAAPPLQTRGVPVSYTVTMEPTRKEWLFALELPAKPPPQAEFTHDMQIHGRGQVESRTRYTLVSYPDYTLGASSHAELTRALQLPPGRHSRAAALSADWRADGLNDREIVDRALRMFSEQEFYYTLAPPLLARDPVDEFLFETRRGFCEHFAASFVVLMRAAGIPARVVTGYQGGTLNPIGNYLIVRQHDAHAWTEVWLDEDGWRRFDPTAAVAPGRILDGLENALPGAIVSVPLGLADNEIARGVWERMRNTWDAVNNQWNQWVLGYDQRRQSLFLQRIGLGRLGRAGLMAGLTLAAAAALIAVSMWLFRGRSRERDQAKRLYDRFCRRLARSGLPRRPGEGPLDYVRRAARRFPASAGTIEIIGKLYIAVRYGDLSERLPELRDRVRAFRMAVPEG
jgi:transglutaminase-like putative cysteine protease